MVEVAKQMVRSLEYRPPPVRRLDELVPGELAHVFQNAIAQDDAGRLFLDPVARLVQPLPGTDVPVRLTEDGEHELLLEGLTDFDGWSGTHARPHCVLPARACGSPTPRPTGTTPGSSPSTTDVPDREA